MSYSFAIFDFDGTLADSFPFFMHAQRVLADRHGFSRVEPTEVESLRRSSVAQILARSRLPAWKLPLVARDYRAMMRDATGVPLFDGIEPMLGELAERGVVLGLLTSNARDNVERVMGSDAFARFAHIECGMSILGKRPRIRAMLRRAGVAPADAIYIGDQDSDGEAANAEGVAFGAVGWGYGAPELLRLHAKHEFVHVQDIAALWAGSTS
ncbi:MAG: haloacid dehalogenase [Lysobacteraceae bacterium]|nr:MAG: haloacid dehalogenase [Xanthomonadaceae bacterium]